MTDATARLIAALEGDVSWTTLPYDSKELIAAAERHGVTALIWEVLQSQHRSALDPLLYESLEQAARAAVARELLVARELTAISDALADADVCALLIKGAALAYTAYRQPWHRPRTDTDILVHPQDAAAACAALEAAGHRRSDALTSGTLVSAQAAYERSGAASVRHVVDLHWKAVNPQVLAGALPFDVLWNGAQLVPRLGPAGRAPSTVDALLLACIHRLAHHQGHDRLVWLYDIRLLAGTLSPDGWQELSEVTGQRGVAGVCLDGLRRAHELLGAPLPPATARMLAALAPTEPSRAYVERAVHRRDVLASDLALLPTWSQRFRLIREHAFPPAAFIRSRYGVQSSLWLPALYMHRLVTGAARWVRP
jgi:hypothetical protein